MRVNDYITNVMHKQFYLKQKGGKSFRYLLDSLQGSKETDCTGKNVTMYCHFGPMRKYRSWVASDSYSHKNQIYENNTLWNIFEYIILKSNHILLIEEKMLKWLIDVHMWIVSILKINTTINMKCY